MTTKRDRGRDRDKGSDRDSDRDRDRRDRDRVGDSDRDRDSDRYSDRYSDKDSDRDRGSYRTVILTGTGADLGAVIDRDSNRYRGVIETEIGTVTEDGASAGTRRGMLGAICYRALRSNFLTPQNKLFLKLPHQYRLKRND